MTEGLNGCTCVPILGSSGVHVNGKIGLFIGTVEIALKKNKGACKHPVLTAGEFGLA